jgi:glycosyltransferase involved in cell wall biosynthesis
MSLPRITIVTPSFNQGRYIEATLLSVLQQDYPNLEYIVIDGGSTDGSVDIIRRYADRLAYWVSEPDGGQSAAIASGFERATGDILAWLNSDDLYLPGALRVVADAFAADPRADFVYGTRRVIDSEGKECRRYSPPTLLHRYYFSFGQWIPQECAFWRRALYDRVGGLDRGKGFSLDFSLFVRMWSQGKFKRIDSELGAFRIHDASKTSRLADLREREGEAIRLDNGIPQIRSPRLYRVGERLLHWQGAIESIAQTVLQAGRVLAKERWSRRRRLDDRRTPSK